MIPFGFGLGKESPTLPAISAEFQEEGGHGSMRDGGGGIPRSLYQSALPAVVSWLIAAPTDPFFQGVSASRNCLPRDVLSHHALGGNPQPLADC